MSSSSICREKEGASFLLTHVEADHFFLSTQDEFAVREGKRTPETEVLVLGEFGAEDVGAGELPVTLRRRFHEAQDAVFAILDDEHAVGEEAATAAHEGLITGAPEFLAIEIKADEAALLATGAGIMVVVFVGEHVEVLVDDEGRVNLGAFLGAPELTDFIVAAGLFHREHFGTAAVSAGGEEPVFIDLGRDGNGNPVGVEIRMPEFFSGFGIVAVESTVVSGGEEDNLFLAPEVHHGG